ncbi:alpha/beta hydrolase family protein [Aurantiacibacter sp. D1-12]|uniref:alpha/beta hydrolase family protein n=1 Tax=Aurantiacibacter sp. D1-12 TaxID=2993658 RepID=UPI00237CFC4E|nr:alpha/beta hydrolase [Aurantiacibacter sp. D1-12]MDE1467234.1 hypothetical protein [Aurantiacibacter sp. D1-12]
MRLFLVLAALLLSHPVQATEAITADDFDHFSARDPAMGEVTWHLDNANVETRGDLVVWLPGSGAFPHFQSFDDGSAGYSFPRELFAFREDAHFMLIDKPGLPFLADMIFDEERGRPVQLDSPDYRAGIELHNLVERSAFAIAQAKRAYPDRFDRVIVIGGSEGAQYVFALARLVNADKAVGWGGLALPQYFDFVLEQRLMAERGEITREEAQSNVEDILGEIASVHADPTSITPGFYGEANRRWSSFGPYAAIDDMLALDIPLLLVQGGADRAAPIMNTDFAAIMFAANGRTNLDYWVYPEADHFMRTRDPANPAQSVSIAPEVWARIWEWVSAA